MPHAAVTFLGRLGGLLLAAGAALLLPADALVGSDLLWGALSGAGVAVQYVALGQAGPVSGLRPVVAGRTAAVLREHVSRRQAAGLPGPPRRPCCSPSAEGPRPPSAQPHDAE
ncbi:hypothetical protein [Streptomyces sp. NPDC059781]|uniref:hypothetical protein n=1 Tax=unclassified Streptomyces TaxID=2593676 RepID=UPI003661CEAE